MTNTYKPRRKPCPIHCPCLCHDTGGGVQAFHPVGGGPCVGKVAGRTVGDEIYERVS